MKNNCLIFKPGNLKSYEKQILYFINNKHKIKLLGISSYKNAKKNLTYLKIVKNF